MSLFGYFGGVDVYPTDLGSRLEQYRFPKSKKQRIRKKWRKNRANWRSVPIRGCYQLGGRFVCDRATYADLKSQLAAL